MPAAEDTTLRPESIVVTAGRPHEPGSPLSTPIVLTAPYLHDTDDENHYARHDVTATVASLEQAIGTLEGGRALAFSSGIAAIASVVEGRHSGSVAVVPNESYSGTYAIFDEQVRLGRLTLRRVDIGDTAAVVAALDGADLLWLETVTNPLMTIPDIPTLASAAHEAGAIVVVDATFSTPLVVAPLDLGADVVVHSATKYFGGHSDVLLGVAVTRDGTLFDELHNRRTATGAIPGALEAFLTTRGIRTLALRMERAQANAAELARRLDAHPAVSRVRYPGLATHPGHEIAARDHRGFGAMVCFELAGGPDAADALCSSVRLISHATSLGGVESLIERRAAHQIDRDFGTPQNLVRLSVGIEHVDDLWADLDAALV